MSGGIIPFNRRQHELIWLCLESIQSDIKIIGKRLDRIDS